MSMREYTPKEISVFDGVIRLVCDGKDLYNIKVQQIAEAAGMGKGTLYEYFSSREEILASALIYYLMQEIRTLENMVKQKDTFEDKLATLLDFVYTAMSSHASTFTLVTTTIHEESMHKTLMEHDQDRRDILECFFVVIDDIVACAKAEGKAGDISAQYARMSVSGMLFSTALFCTDSINDKWQNIKQDAIKIITKSLE